MNTENAKASAKAYVADIVELVAALQEAGDDNDEALEAIWNDPLSVEYRSGWSIAGSQIEPEEYRIMLGTGGPAVQITGNIGPDNTPMDAEVQYQDWFIPWTALPLSDEEQVAVLAYAQQFHFFHPSK